MNSSFISTIQSVQIWHNDYLLGVDDNIGFLSDICNKVKYTYNQFMACYTTLPSFLTNDVHTLHNYCLWDLNYKERYISPGVKD